MSTTTETKEQVDTSIETLQQGGIPGQQAEAPAPDVELAGEETPPEGELGEPPAEEPSEQEPLGRSKKSDLAESWDDDWGSSEPTEDDGMDMEEDLSPDERKEQERMEREFLARGGNVTQGSAKRARGAEKSQRMRGGHIPRTGTAQAAAPTLAYGKLKENSLMGANPYEIMDYNRLKQKAGSDPKARQELTRRGPQPTPSLGMKPSATGVSNPYDIASDQRLQQLAAKGDANANQELQRRKTLGLPEAQLQEVAPPGEKAERFIRQNKEKFRKQYGDRAEEVLYSTAWKQFGKKEESYTRNQARLETNKKHISSLEKTLQEHRQTWKQQLAEGTVVDPLNTGYGLEGEVVAGKLAQAQQHQRKVETWLAAYRNQGIHKLQEQVATVVQIRKLVQAKKHAPWGLAYQDKQGQQQQKFFESRDNAKLWRDLNAKDIKVVQMFGPRDFDKKIARLQGTL